MTDIETNAEVTELRATIAQDDDNSNLFVGADVASIKAVKCKRKQDTVCRILLQMTDDSVVMLQQGKVKWSREESLANIATMDMVELPLSYLEGTIEDEFKSKDGELGLERYLAIALGTVQPVPSMWCPICASL